MTAEWKTCDTCTEYRRRRTDALVGPLADKAIAESRDVADVIHDYMSGVHRRHLSGLSLATAEQDEATS